MTDREERQHVIEVLKQMRLDYEDFWEENDTEEIKAFNYAIASIETDLKYDLLYEETIEQKKPTTETCETCRYYGSHHGVCDYCYKCSLWTEKEPSGSENPTGSTTNDNLGVDYLGVDAISRQAINGYIDYILSHGMGKRKSFEFIKKFVANLPPVTPQPKTGHWDDIPKYKDIAWQCSECGHFTTMKHNFCPDCGCAMVEPQESEEE